MFDTIKKADTGDDQHNQDHKTQRFCFFNKYQNLPFGNLDFLVGIIGDTWYKMIEKEIENPVTEDFRLLTVRSRNGHCFAGGESRDQGQRGSSLNRVGVVEGRCPPSPLGFIAFVPIRQNLR